jgi:hypothetical protein
VAWEGFAIAGRDDGSLSLGAMRFRPRSSTAREERPPPLHACASSHPLHRRRVLKRIVFILMVSALAATSRAADASPLAGYDHVRVEPSKTSIYIGSVTMTLTEFLRHDGAYTADYTAKVVPYFFFNEAGKLTIDFSDEQLRQLARGEVVAFTGKGIRSDGVERRVEGKATPADAGSGKIKVRVFVSKRTELIFNTTYRFKK